MPNLSAKHEVTEPISRPNPPALLFLALVSQIALHVLIPGTLSWGGIRLVVGLVLAGLGLWLLGAGAREFERRGTPISPQDSPGTMVTSGPFRISRNPMYLGMLSLLAGTASLLGSLSPFAVVPLFAGVLTYRFVRPEEERMRQLFGSEYTAYSERVRRWL